MFSEKEIAYLKSQRLERIATVFNQLQPDVAPVGFDFDGTYSYVGDSLNHPVIERNFPRQIRIAARRYTLTNLL